MKTITLTPAEYIEFCLYYNNLPWKDANMQVQTTFLKGKVEITGNEEFLTRMGYIE
jgi:hypothetical protein